MAGQKAYNSVQLEQYNQWFKDYLTERITELGGEEEDATSWDEVSFENSLDQQNNAFAEADPFAPAPVVAPPPIFESAPGGEDSARTLADIRRAEWEQVVAQDEAEGGNVINQLANSDTLDLSDDNSSEDWLKDLDSLGEIQEEASVTSILETSPVDLGQEFIENSEEGFSFVDSLEPEATDALAEIDFGDLENETPPLNEINENTVAQANEELDLTVAAAPSGADGWDEDETPSAEIAEEELDFVESDDQEKILAGEGEIFVTEAADDEEEEIFVTEAVDDEEEEIFVTEAADVEEEEIFVTEATDDEEEEIFVTEATDDEEEEIFITEAEEGEEKVFNAESEEFVSETTFSASDSLADEDLFDALTSDQPIETDLGKPESDGFSALDDFGDDLSLDELTTDNQKPSAPAEKKKNPPENLPLFGDDDFENWK